MSVVYALSICSSRTWWQIQLNSPKTVTWYTHHPSLPAWENVPWWHCRGGNRIMCFNFPPFLFYLPRSLHGQSLLPRLSVERLGVFLSQPPTVNHNLSSLADFAIWSAIRQTGHDRQVIYNVKLQALIFFNYLNLKIK
jgi:hypothetical protein